MLDNNKFRDSAGNGKSDVGQPHSAFEEEKRKRNKEAICDFGVNAERD